MAASWASGQEAPRTNERAPFPGPGVPGVADSLAVPFERPNGALLRTGSITYDLTMSRAGQVTSLGTRVVEVSEGQVNGMPAWIIVETRVGSVVPTSDSLFLTRGGLVPVRWAATSGRAQLGASFTRDTMFAALQSYQGRASFSLATTPHTLVTGGMVERILELLPLAPGYRAAAMVLIVEPGTPRLEPATLAVDREESLLVGDRPVDCWVVALRTGRTEQRLWVSRDLPRVMKTEQTFAGGLLTSLVRIEPRPSVEPATTPPPPPPPPAPRRR